ncbi:hypothetical protein EHQ43_09530 [Leptospira bouyouniensis]|uniref:Toxin-antitoxin system YwqK family antitoxin n=1 Tax=Leptospira bouyouniensis TaxID=2484911 RepID=A0A7I0HSY3_9LEPT|nr:hypothetical protein [Leptospira bouyouniensis]TGL06638.1 hypothetical protein EHQ43_09530 [Leptospira bouyouniensis]
MVRILFPVFCFSLLLCLSCAKQRVELGNQNLSKDQNHFLLYHGERFTGILIAENPILKETYETEFYKGAPHGSYTVTSYDGMVLESRFVRYGQKHGKHTLYYPNGKLRQISEYDNGIPIGEHIEYFDNGEISSYQTFFPSGKPKVAKKWNKRGQIYLNHVFLESGESFGRPGSKLCEPIPDNGFNQTKSDNLNPTTKQTPFENR